MVGEYELIGSLAPLGGYAAFVWVVYEQGKKAIAEAKENGKTLEQIQRTLLEQNQLLASGQARTCEALTRVDHQQEEILRAVGGNGYGPKKRR